MWFAGFGVGMFIVIAEFNSCGITPYTLKLAGGWVVLFLLYAKFIGYPDYLVEFNKQKALEDAQKRREDEIHQANLERIRAGKP